MTMAHDDHLSDDQLLRLVDGHLSPLAHAAAASHADRCGQCSARRELFTRLGAPQAPARDEEARRDLRDLAVTRARLQTRLAREAERSSRWPALVRLAPWTTAPAVVALGALLLIVAARPPEGSNRTDGILVESDARPIASLTPGLAVDLPAGELCTQAPRPAQAIGEAVRLAVLRSYGMEQVPPDQYELDYLITPELGGAPDARNLWPQRYRERVWNAGVKDQLEDLLPRLVCQGRLDLRTAQREIAHDWVGAYRKHFRTSAPLRSQAAAAGLIVRRDAEIR
jgi:hypothetical protein